jgi:hypothetical protein
VVLALLLGRLLLVLGGGLPGVLGGGRDLVDLLSRESIHSKMQARVDATNQPSFFATYQLPMSIIPFACYFFFPAFLMSPSAPLHPISLTHRVGGLLVVALLEHRGQVQLGYCHGAGCGSEPAGWVKGCGLEVQGA